MRVVPTSMTNAWKSQAKIGNQRPVARAMIHRQDMFKFQYDTAWVNGGTYDTDRHRAGHFTSMVFGDLSGAREVPNIKSIEWERSVDQDAGTCTMVLTNTEMVPIGQPQNDDSDNEFDRPGYLSYNRGDQKISSDRWGYETTGWSTILVPDMTVKTFEGYGCDMNVPPQLDPHMIESGVWLIDKVTYGADGSISVEMRDYARLLLDQIVFPPSIPASEYPLAWQKLHSENVPSRDAQGGHWMDRLGRIGTAKSSNDFYIGKGFTNHPFTQYVSGTGGVDGHAAAHALLRHDIADHPSDAQLFWRSSGQDSVNSFSWWEFDITGPAVPLAALRLDMTGGPYRVYISVHNGTKWLGKKKIPYKQNGISGSPGNIDINGDIPFVSSIISDRHFNFDVTLPRKYLAKRIRITITHQWATAVGEHPFRVGLRQMQIYTAKNLSDLSFHKGEVLKIVGNYGDYTMIVKWVCAWGGFFWPPHSSGLDFIRVESGNGSGAYTKDWITQLNADPDIPIGRVWGDFMVSGTYGLADLTVDMFDKKPLMDIINYIRDLLGFNFWIDENAGVCWRMPNIWSLGNYLTPTSVNGSPGKRRRYERTSDIVTIDENETLLAYSTVLDGTNIRDRIFVGNAVGGVGSVIKGFRPYPPDLQRVAGWTDQNFVSTNETRVMADMIAARAMFTYRTSTATIPGYPCIQVDDQVRIFERVTNETYYHYVQGIKSTLDMETGEWTYDLSTHWLGESPSDAWVVDSTELAGVTQQYLHAIGYSTTGFADSDS